MKDWNAILLETIIRDNLLEQYETQAAKSKIIPWQGLSGERKIRRAKKQLNLTAPVIDGFTVVNRGTENVSVSDIVNAIETNVRFGVGSRYDREDNVYIVSEDARDSDNKSKRDVVIIKQADWDLLSQFRRFSQEFSDIAPTVGADVQLFLVPRTSTKLNSWMMFPTDIERLKNAITKFQSSIQTIKLTGPENEVLRQKLEDAEQKLERLKQKTTPYTADTESDDVVDNLEDVIKQVTNTSNTEDVAQLQRDIINMINNNPQIYQTDTEFKEIFDLFIKKYKDDGNWCNNMSDMVELINQGFDDGTSRTSVSIPTYKKIIKYQSEKL